MKKKLYTVFFIENIGYRQTYQGKKDYLSTYYQQIVDNFLTFHIDRIILNKFVFFLDISTFFAIIESMFFNVEEVDTR